MKKDLFGKFNRTLRSYHVLLGPIAIAIYSTVEKIADKENVVAVLTRQLSCMVIEIIILTFIFMAVDSIEQSLSDYYK